MTRVAAVVLSFGAGRELYQRLRDLRSQANGDIQIILVDTDESADMPRRILESLNRDDDVVVVKPTAAKTPGAWRNAGVAATSCEAILFLEAGYKLAPTYCESALNELGETPGLGFVTSGLKVETGGERSSAKVPRACDLSTVLSNPEAIHPCTLFRRALWENLEGFDETLLHLELYEFWIRVLAAGTRGSILSESLVTRTILSKIDRCALERDRHVPAITYIFKKHQPLFEEDTKAVLITKEKALYDLEARYQPILKRREAAVQEVENLNQEILHLTDTLQTHGRDRVDLGDLRRTLPLSSEWGTDRGQPIDRYYIEKYLSVHSEDIRGTVLEVQEAEYTRLFGGERVVVSDVVDADATNSRATIVTDLRRAEEIPSNMYDCFIITQTLHVIDDMRAVLRECVRFLRPGGNLLMTFPCLSRVCLEYGEDADFWRLTEAGVRNLLYEFFDPRDVETQAYGNVLTATAFLYGMSSEELTESEFESYDPYHPVLVGARATKREKTTKRQAASQLVRQSDAEAVILGYHRVAESTPDPHMMCVPPQEFRHQMEHLSSNYQTLSLNELVCKAQSGDLPRRAVAVTFDDGYLDALTTASPVLSDLGIPATFFVSTELLDGRGNFWWDSLQDIFCQHHDLPDSLELSIDGEERTFGTLNPADRLETHRLLYPYFLRSPPAQRSELLRQVIRWSGADPSPQSLGRPMNQEELRLLSKRDGHTIGAHTVHHLALSHQSFDTQRQEIMEGKSALERILQRPVSTFAYPFGDYCDSAADLLRAASFRHAVTCCESAIPVRVDPFRLPRWTVPADCRPTFGEWIEGCFIRKTHQVPSSAA